VNKTLGLLSLIAFALGSVAQAQTKQDEKAVRELPQAFSNAWAKHDGHELAKIMAEDVDFVTVGATWFGVRVDFEKHRTRLLSGRFHDSTLTLLQTAVPVPPELQDIKPPIAVPPTGQ